MATIVLIDPDPDFPRFQGKGSTLTTTQAGHTIRRKSGPTNRQTTAIMLNRRRLKDTHVFYDQMLVVDQFFYGIMAFLNSIGVEIEDREEMRRRMAVCTVNVPLIIAGFPFQNAAPDPVHIDLGKTYTPTLIDKDTVRISWAGGALPANHKLQVRQTLPHPGRRKPSIHEARLCEYSAAAPASPVDFQTKYQHLPGLTSRYFINARNSGGFWEVPEIYDLTG